MNDKQYRDKEIESQPGLPGYHVMVCNAEQKNPGDMYSCRKFRPIQSLRSTFPIGTVFSSSPNQKEARSEWSPNFSGPCMRLAVSILYNWQKRWVPWTLGQMPRSGEK